MTYEPHRDCAPSCASREGPDGACARLRANGVRALFEAPAPPCREPLLRRVGWHAREVARVVESVEASDASQAIQMRLIALKIEQPYLAAVLALARTSARFVVRDHGVRLEKPRCSGCTGLAPAFDADGARHCAEPSSPAYDRVVVVLRRRSPACEVHSEKKSPRVDACRWVRPQPGGQWACTNAACPYASDPPRVDRTPAELACDRFEDRLTARVAVVSASDFRADAAHLGAGGVRAKIAELFGVIEARAMLREALREDPKSVVTRWLPEASEPEKREIARVLSDILGALEGSDE